MPGSSLPAVRARNAVVMSNGVLDWGRPETWTGMIDRSPCGTGTCAVMAMLHARGELQVGVGSDEPRLSPSEPSPSCDRRSMGVD